MKSYLRFWKKLDVWVWIASFWPLWIIMPLDERFDDGVWLYYFASSYLILLIVYACFRVRSVKLFFFNFLGPLLLSFFVFFLVAILSMIFSGLEGIQ